MREREKIKTAGGGDTLGTSPSPKLHRNFVSCSVLWDRGQDLLIWLKCPFSLALQPWVLPISQDVLNHNFQFIHLSSSSVMTSQLQEPRLTHLASPMPSSGSDTVGTDCHTRLHNPLQPVCSIGWSSQESITRLLYKCSTSTPISHVSDTEVREVWV